MNGQKNPFSNLYHTESLSTDHFVKIFSPKLLRESRTHELFQPGSVVLTGLQGSGKSALLNLLKPEVLIAYQKSDEPWPLPKHCSKFLSASITLRSSGALDFGQRAIPQETQAETENKKILGLFFGDFLNYWIIDDLLNNVDLLGSPEGSILGEFLGLDVSGEKLDYFATSLKKDSCWFGVMDDVEDYEGLRLKVKDRIWGYESYLNYNSDFPIEYVKTKTKPGAPIGCVADALKRAGLIPLDLPVFVTIDQFEDLMDLERDEKGDAAPTFRSVIIRMLGDRDRRVSYRVGARPYSLGKGLQGFGNNAFTEEMREYEVVDIRKVLKGTESRKALFQEFCEDVLERRIKFSGFIGTGTQNVLKTVFGSRPTVEQKVDSFIRGSRTSVISKDFPGSAAIRSELVKISVNDPISAKMGEAWVRQNIKETEISPELVQKQPWNERKYWKKERKQQALLQVFSACRQRLSWYGAHDIVLLSGKNIFAFLSICQFIWAENMRSNDHEAHNLPEQIDPHIQSMGIHSASEHWFRKVRAEPKGGDDRHRFVSILGTFLRDRLRNDKNMSYPGENGFSLSSGQLEQQVFIEDFIESCVEFGVLEHSAHTPKSKSRGQSQKWHLSSILTPYFQVPTPHTKEPFYASIDDVNKWMQAALIAPPSGLISDVKAKRSKTTLNIAQLDLDFRHGDED
jgi:energy-coupling factor transporter ATP-binding protein EcfA2